MKNHSTSGRNYELIRKADVFHADRENEFKNISLARLQEGFNINGFFSKKRYPCNNNRLKQLSKQLKKDLQEKETLIIRCSKSLIE